MRIVSYAAIAARKPRTARRATQKQDQQRARTGNVPMVSSGDGNRSGATARSNTSSPATTVHASPRETVRGARRVWGTLPLITCTTVRNTISRLTQLSCVNEIQVRRKFVSGQSTRSGKDKWWFVLHGGEDILQSLEAVWETVKLQTGWQLEQCTKPIAESGVDAIQPPPTKNSSDRQVPNDTSTPIDTDTTIPHHSHSQTSTNPVPSPDQNQSSTSHSFVETIQVTHPPPPLN